MKRNPDKNPATYKLSARISDADRSRIACQLQQMGEGPVNLYSVHDRQGTLCMLVTAVCAEDAVATCNYLAGVDWHMNNTVTRRVMRNLDEDAGQILAAVRLHNSRQGASANWIGRRNSTSEVAGLSPAALAKTKR